MCWYFCIINCNQLGNWLVVIVWGVAEKIQLNYNLDIFSNDSNVCCCNIIRATSSILHSFPWKEKHTLAFNVHTSGAFYLFHICQALLLSNRLVLGLCCGLLRLGSRGAALWLGVALRVWGAVWLGVVRPPPLAAMFTFWLTSCVRRRVVGFFGRWVATGTDMF